MNAAPRAPDSDLEAITIEAFHRAVRTLRARTAQALDSRVLQALEEGRLLPWPTYAAAMFEWDITPECRRHLAGLWQAARTHQENQPLLEPAGDQSRPVAYRAAVAISDTELAATTEAEFVELLRLIRRRSGCSPAEIGRRAGIPRSQAYALVDKRRDTAPTNPDQLRAFLHACGLPEPQTAQVLRLWTTLRDVRQVPDYTFVHTRTQQFFPG